MMMKGPFREIFPVGAQLVSLRLTSGLKPKAARLLVAGTDAQIRMKGDAAEISVPSVGIHEVVAFDLT